MEDNSKQPAARESVDSTALLDALHRAEKTMKERAYADYERYNPLDCDKCLIWVEATMREVRKEIEEASNRNTYGIKDWDCFLKK